MSNINPDRKAKITLIKKLARQHPDWGWEKVQRAVRKQMGSSIANVEAHEHIIKARQPKPKKKSSQKKEEKKVSPAESEAAIRVTEGIALLHPDWGKDRVNKEQRKVTGITLSSTQLNQALKARKEQEMAIKEKAARRKVQEKAHARHQSLNRAQQLAKEHPEWGRRKIAKQLKAEGLQGLRTSTLGEAIRRARGLRKKPSKYEVYFAAKGVKKDVSPWVAFYSSKLFRKTTWRYNSTKRINEYQYFIKRLNRGINEKYGYRGIHRIQDFPEWDFAYYLYQHNPATGGYKVITEVTGSNRRGINPVQRGFLT